LTSRTFTRSAVALATLAVLAGPLAGAADAAPKPKVPAPVITAKPPARTRATSATFEFTDSLLGVTYQCQLDASAWSACASPKTYAGPLSNALHTFRVRARNAAGTLSQATTATWPGDTVAPPAPVLSGVPASPTGATSASIGFTDEEAGVTFRCAVDGAAATTCTPPVALGPLADGTHTFTVTALDAVGNASVPSTAAWTVDTSPPPAPTVTSAPANVTNATTATFVVHDADPTATLSCSLDGAAYAPCTSPVTYESLAESAHTFDVKALDELSNSASATQYAWTVDLTAPAPPTVLTGPAAVTKNAVSSFTFDPHDAVLLECSIDSTTEFAACLAAYDTPSLADGAHTLRVRGTDAATNVSGATPYTWTADTTPPPVPSVAGPAAASNVTTATFTIGSTEDFVTFTCALDGAAAAPCASGVAFADLANGAHSLVVTSTDAAGNTAQATFGWTVDTVAPTASVAAPADLTSPISVTFSEPVLGVSVVLRLASSITPLPSTFVAGPGNSVLLKPASRLVPGQRYVVYVASATDYAGNMLTPAFVPFRALTAIQENSPAVQYGWRGVRTSAAYGGIFVQERLGGATVSYPFTGTGLTWYTITGPDQGKADVFVDGVLKATVSNYATRTTYRVPRSVGGLSNAAHTLKIVVRGQKGATAATNTLVSVDAVKVGATLVTNPALAYAWKKLGAAAASAGAYTLADLAQSTVQMQFRGTSVTWYTVGGRNHGRAQVWIDGVLKATVDNYAATTTYNVRRPFGGLTDGLHTVKIVVLGQRRTGATGTTVALDRLMIG